MGAKAWRKKRQVGTEEPGRGLKEFVTSEPTGAGGKRCWETMPHAHPKAAVKAQILSLVLKSAESFPLPTSTLPRTNPTQARLATSVSSSRRLAARNYVCSI